MRFLRFVQASVCILSLPFSEARIGNILAGRLGLFRRDVCVEDEWLAAVRAEPNAQVSCSEFRTSANATVTTYVTPTLTTTNIRTTSTVTVIISTRATSTVTVTPTPGTNMPRYKRGPAPTEPAVLDKRASAAENVDAFFELARAEAANDSSSLDPFVSSLFSIITSACDCLSLGPIFTSTVTSTDVPDTKDKTGWTVTTIEVSSTFVARTVTVTASPTSVVASSTVISTSTVIVTPVPASSEPPIGHGYNCPVANNTTQAMVFGSETYLFQIFCNAFFANESSLTTSPASSEADCSSQCAVADGLAHAPFCRGFSFDGVSCALYSEALGNHLIATDGVDSAVLVDVYATNSTFQNRTIEVSESYSIVASVTSGVTYITPPPVSTGTTTCFTSTYTNSTDGLAYWTQGCASNFAWWASWTVSATRIYSSQVVIYGEGSGRGGGGGSGGDLAGVHGSTGQTITQVTPTATSGSGVTSTGAGSAWESTLTTIISGSTYVTVISGGASGWGSGHNATGGVINSSSGATGGSGNGSNGTGGILFPATSTVTTISGGLTVTFVTTYLTSGSGSGSTGTGGIISATPWNFSTSIGGASTHATIISGETGGQGGGSTVTGGVLSMSSNSTFTIVNATTLTFNETGQTSGDTFGSSGTGGIITLPTGEATTTTGAISGGGEGSSETGGVVKTSVNGTGPMYYSTFFNATTTVAVSTGHTSKGSEGSAGTGGVITPTSNGTFSRQPSEKPRSGSASPPVSGTAPPSESWTPYPNITWVISPMPPETTPTDIGTATSGYPLPPSNSSWSRTGTEKPRSGSQSPSGPSVYPYPYPTPNSTWLGELHSGPSTTPTPTKGYPGYPPFNYTTTPIGTGSQPINDTNTFSRSRTDKPRSGSQSPFGSPTPGINSTYCVTSALRETVTQTIYTGSENCVCITTSFPSYNPEPTYTYVTSSTSASSTTSAPSPAVTSIDQQRKAGENATASQIEASCKYVGNQIFNGEFELQDSDGFPLGWGFSSTSNQIGIISHADATQHTTGGSRDARIESANATALARFYQPLTLCPNATYALTAWTRQPRVLAECAAVFNLGGVEVGRVSPGQVWGSGVSNSKTYTVGAAATDAAVDFEIGVQCRGSGDSGGKRVVEFDDLDLSVVV